jgi:hypothetical protein
MVGGLKRRGYFLKGCQKFSIMWHVKSDHSEPSRPRRQKSALQERSGRRSGVSHDASPTQLPKRKATDDACLRDRNKGRTRNVN